MKIVFLPRAVQDLHWFKLYYRDVFPEGAKRAAERYGRTLELIAATPKLGRPVAEPGIREYAMPRTPFSLIYRIAGSRIEVLRVWDQRSERIEEWLGESP